MSPFCVLFIPLLSLFKCLWSPRSIFSRTLLCSIKAHTHSPFSSFLQAHCLNRAWHCFSRRECLQPFLCRSLGCVLVFRRNSSVQILQLLLLLHLLLHLVILHHRQKSRQVCSEKPYQHLSIQDPVWRRKYFPVCSIERTTLPLLAAAEEAAAEVWPLWNEDKPRDVRSWWGLRRCPRRRRCRRVKPWSSAWRRTEAAGEG